MSIQKRIEELSELIIKNKSLYYEGKAVLSDHQYDALENELRSLDPKHPSLFIVGASVKGEKVPHKKKMLSLQKTYVLDDLISWKGDREIVSTEKIDGSSCSLIYSSGSLILAKTRGDGEFGENITSKLLLIPSVPNIIDDKSQELEIRGEVYCTQENFHLLSEEMQKLGLEAPASLRNIVAGILGRKENIELSRFLSFKAFDLLDLNLLGLDGSDKILNKESEKFNYLKSLDFIIPEYLIHQNEKSIESALEQTKLFMNEGNYLIDGIVFSYEELELHGQLGETSHHPRYKMAFKFAGESKQTKIKDITWQVSRNGVLTPVAEVEPVEVSGALISRVTLHNWGVVRDFSLKKDDVIEIERSGEVIPKFIKVVESSKNEFVQPMNCPCCDSVVDEVDIRLFCTNEKCPDKVLEFTKYFVKSLGIDDLSTERLKEMYHKKLISGPEDLFKLKAEALMSELEGYKETLAQKVIKSIQKKSNPTLLIFLVSLGLTGGGKNKCEKLLNGLKLESINEVLELDIERVSSVEGFAEKSAKSFLDSLASNQSLIDDLLKSGMSIQKTEYSNEVGALDQKSFCITGTLTRPRSEIQNWIKSQGGKVVSSVSSKTDYLVCNEESSSSKYKKAQSLEIAIISEEQLFSLS